MELANTLSMGFVLAATRTVIIVYHLPAAIYASRMQCYWVKYVSSLHVLRPVALAQALYQHAPPAPQENYSISRSVMTPAHPELINRMEHAAQSIKALLFSQYRSLV